MVKGFLVGTEMTEEQIDRITYIVGHHHTFSNIDGADYQILIEAGYIANASENGYSNNNVQGFVSRIMKTESGKRLAESVLCA